MSGNRRIWLAVGVIAVVLVGIAVWLVFLRDTRDDPGGEVIFRTDGGAEFKTGELDEEAVARAKSFAPWPVLWLGEEFHGLQLTTAERLQDGMFFLVYGGCRPPKHASEPSCVVPLQIQIQPAGGIPDVARVDPADFRGVIRTPGELARGSPESRGWDSTILWLPGGATVKVYVATGAVGGVTEEALQSLRSANHEAMGYPAVGPGEDLSVIP